VALDLPGEVRQAIGEAISRLQSESAQTANADGRVRWARPEGMHVTLKFIGHAIAASETERFHDVRTALAAVRSSGPVEMRFRGAGFFPSARLPRVLWCGVEASDNLAQLAAGIDRALAPMGIPREVPAFVPHLTLARFNSRRDNPRKRNSGRGAGRSGIAELVRAAAAMALTDFGSARETEFHLFESILKPTGAEYRKIETYSFWKEAA